MSDLPRGWEWANMAELMGAGLFSDGDWVETKDQDPDGEVRLLQLADIGEGHFRDRSNRYLTTKSATALGCTYLEPGDVLVARMPEPLGRACRVPRLDQPAITAVDVCILRPTPTGVDPEWLMWAINAPQARRQITALQSGTTRKRISRNNLATIRLAVPPRREQERVVAAIEEHLSRLDAADVALRSSGRRLGVLQQRLVDATVEGEPVRLGHLLREPLRNGLSARASLDGSIRVVTLTAVTEAAFVEDNTKLIDPVARSVDELWMQPGDIFIQRSNTPELVGTAALFDGPVDWAIFPDLLIRVRVDPERVEPAYMALVLRSTRLRQYFQRSAQGIAGSMPKISQPVVESAPIPLPPLEKQRAILGKVNAEVEAGGRLRFEIHRAERRATSLRRSILAAAVSGQLLSQDSDDEPASVLLESIRAERAATTPTKRARKAKVL